MNHLGLFISARGDSSAPLRRGIEQCGFRLVGVEGLGAAIDSLHQWGFDAVLLDSHGLGPASVNGVRLLRARCAAPIVVLDEGGREEFQLQCLVAGATDVVEPGASPRLVGWKLRQLVQAVAAPRRADRQELRIGRLRLDPARATARFDTVALELSASEFDTLLVLVARAGQPVGRGELAGPTASPQAVTGRSIDTRIYRIRRHLEAAGATELDLATVHGRGYRLSLAPAAEAQGWSRAPRLHLAGQRRRDGLSAPRTWRP